jgi:hypothetical protein
MPCSERIVRVGCTPVAAVQRECRGRGCPCTADAGTLCRVQKSGGAEPAEGNGPGGDAGGKTTPGSVPSEEPRRVGLVADDQAHGPDASAGDGIERYQSGAIRSSVPERWDLIPATGLRRVAEAMAHGAARYGENNWTKGMPVKSVLNHAIKHLYQWLDGDRSEDHLGHAAANLMMACHSDERWPHLNP